MTKIDQAFIEEAKMRIAQDEAEDVIEDLIDFLKPQLNSKYFNEVILHSSRINQLNGKIRRGLLTDERATVNRARISNDLLSTLDYIFKRELTKENPRQAPDTNVGINETAGEHYEKLLSQHGLNKISWLSGGMKAARSVCFIRIPELRKVGTGFLLRGGWLMTNHHVLTNAAVAARAEVVFNFETTLNGNRKEETRYQLDASTYQFSPMTELDYVLVKVMDNSDIPLSNWGYLEPETEFIPEKDAFISIIQHPRGRDKEIATDRVTQLNEAGNRLLYAANTEAGSSGSPVFNSQWKVVALHHAASSVFAANQGVLMRNIIQHIQQKG